MRTERLTFQVFPWDFAKDFLMVDAEVWNPWLKRQPGFLNKTNRIVGNGLVELNIFWKDQESLDRASAQDFTHLDKMMRDRSPGSFRLISSKVF